MSTLVLPVWMTDVIDAAWVAVSVSTKFELPAKFRAASAFSVSIVRKAVPNVLDVKLNVLIGLLFPLDVEKSRTVSVWLPLESCSFRFRVFEDPLLKSNPKTWPVSWPPGIESVWTKKVSLDAAPVKVALVKFMPVSATGKKLPLASSMPAGLLAKSLVPPMKTFVGLPSWLKPNELAGVPPPVFGAAVGDQTRPDGDCRIRFVTFEAEPSPVLLLL